MLAFLVSWEREESVNLIAEGPRTTPRHGRDQWIHTLHEEGLSTNEITRLLGYRSHSSIVEAIQRHKERS